MFSLSVFIIFIYGLTSSTAEFSLYSVLWLAKLDFDRVTYLWGLIQTKKSNLVYLFSLTVKNQYKLTHEINFNPETNIKLNQNNAVNELLTVNSKFEFKLCKTPFSAVKSKAKAKLLNNVVFVTTHSTEIIQSIANLTARSRSYWAF